MGNIADYAYFLIFYAKQPSILPMVFNDTGHQLISNISVYKVNRRYQRHRGLPPATTTLVINIEL